MKWHNVCAKFHNNNFSLSEVAESEPRQHGDLKIQITSLFRDESGLIFPKKQRRPEAPQHK